MIDPMSRMTDKTAAKEKGAFDQLSAATEGTRDLAKNSYLMATETAHQCNAKLLEFARVNNDAAFNYAQELSGARSPSEFVEITTRHANAQLAVLTEQAKELTTLGQKVASKSAAPFKSGG
jgi:phasin